MKRIRMFDYLEQYRQLQSEVQAAISRVLESGKLILGPEGAAFERLFAESVGAGYAVGVNSGTDALVIALRALGVEAGDEVITVANTAVPTVSAIRQVGALPVFCDVEADTALLDLNALEGCITAKTRAVVAVHLFGNVVDVPRLRAMLTSQEQRLGVRPIHILEDCAQAQGARLHGTAVGSLGDAGAFSFYPTKNLGAYGDGGLCFTHDAGRANVMRSLRMYGFGDEQHCEREGQNSRLDELQAAILSTKLPHLPAWVAARQRLAATYDGLLRPDIHRVRATPGAEHAYHLYVVRVRNRDVVRSKLAEAGVDTGIHYPCPVHLMRGYAFLGYRAGSLPTTERLSNEILSLPMYPELREDEVRQVCDLLNQFAPTEQA